MRCLITGASGHLGSSLARALLAQGHEVVGLVRPTSDLSRLDGVLPQVRLIRGELGTLDHIADEIRASRCQIVFHCGWQGVTSEFRNDPAQVTTNVTGSLRLLQLAHEAGAETWIGIGSQAEYGVRNTILREDCPTEPVTTYGVTKLCVGLLTRELCRSFGMRHVWLRLLATYGPHDDVRHLIPAVTLQLLAGKKPSLTKGEQCWDYLYIEDAAAALGRIAFESKAAGVFNLSSGAAVPVREIVTKIRDLIDARLPVGLGEIPYGPNPIMHLQADIGRLTDACGWRPQVGLEEGLRRTVEWYRRNARAQ